MTRCSQDAKRYTGRACQRQDTRRWHRHYNDRFARLAFTHCECSVETVNARQIISQQRQTFIPQDAALFSGTLRDNLDPFSAQQ